MEMDCLVTARTRQEWRKWLSDNHRSEAYCWVTLSKNHSLTYLDAVEEALCFGWIDSTKKRVNETDVGQRFSPRKRNSHWTELNKERVRRLDKLGLMTEEGKKVLPEMTSESFTIDEEIIAELEQDEVLYQHFQSLPDLYVRIKIDNIQSVKRIMPCIKNDWRNS
ncbi:uncharacterized protein YdeI (YjbR/CyaY-like superfamily) [Aureibacillus halotolerans]|uniref:Uncharacterized protein YdeI (YjbR/CyaY-like superfamily) n=1 Tax=Aureibacillus halotolerans TaxID=1508390 RepID=A0A4V3D4G2_9BACI|nr:uncharacterized protein YdeI (YjbR/CyaY-like superfamily) [Aureibacillus halotolerans]